ncbi:DUF354 domain-containing protein [Haloarchaeobius sp. TZWWS8]|uniref:DUF354 domain-containing protein n=1 Tax=Haloarchaeobius sp. TZWWS8 TaxID=3446121 RepID=UPI003EB9A19D
MNPFSSSDTDASPPPANVWVDLVSPSHPFFFHSLLSNLDGIDSTVTVREKTETVDLTRELGMDADVLGRDFDNTFLRKIGIPLRTSQCTIQAPKADVSLSSRNAMCVLASKARGIPSIHFTDNDITAHIEGLTFEKLYNRFEAQATHNVVPAAFEVEELTRWGADPESIHTYDGYKEDLYVAQFEPDPEFTDKLPFDEFVTIRPEALGAAYVDTERSLVPDLLDRLVDLGYNVVYLPRGRGDEEHADEYPDDRVYTPDEALDGLELAWHGTCMLTGSGTMAREAACMDKPAVSFFPNTPLSVDQEMVAEGRILHSRDVDEIIDHIEDIGEAEASGDFGRSEQVQQEVLELTADLINRYA